MDALIEQLRSPTWWIGVVAVGILINLVSAYLRKWIDKLLARFSVLYRHRSAIVSKRREDEIESLLREPRQMILYSYRAISSQLRATRFLFLGLVFWALALFGDVKGGPETLTIFAAALGAIAIFIGLIDLKRSYFLEFIIDEASKRVVNPIKE